MYKRNVVIKKATRDVFVLRRSEQIKRKLFRYGTICHQSQLEKEKRENISFVTLFTFH